MNFAWVIHPVLGILLEAAVPVGCDSPSETTRLSMSRVAQRIEIHMLRKGVPANLGVVFPDGVPEDAWGNAYGFVPNQGPKGYELVSFGADGRIGGQGPDEDLFYGSFK